MTFFVRAATNRNPNKEDCDHDHNSIKTQKHNIGYFCEYCDHGHNPQLNIMRGI